MAHLERVFGDVELGIRKFVEAGGKFKLDVAYTKQADGQLVYFDQSRVSNNISESLKDIGIHAEPIGKEGVSAYFIDFREGDENVEIKATLYSVFATIQGTEPYKPRTIEILKNLGNALKSYEPGPGPE